MIGVIINYRRGKRTEYPRQMIIELTGVKTRRDALKQVGKRVRWVSPTGKVFVGRITRAHGNNGSVIASFEEGLPGQAIGTKVEVQ